MAWQNFRIAHKLEKNGLLTDGVITDKWVETFERGILYHVRYRFHDDLDVCESIPKNLCRRLSKGRNVPIRYLKENPLVSRLDMEKFSA
jgi:hypothetical protein